MQEKRADSIHVWVVGYAGELKIMGEVEVVRQDIEIKSRFTWGQTAP